MKAKQKMFGVDGLTDNKLTDLLGIRKKNKKNKMIDLKAASPKLRTSDMKKQTSPMRKQKRGM